MQGLLLVDKPKTWTSFDVVNFVRKQVAQIEGKKPKNCKVGHTGTLDPMATGLLVLLIGKEYTRRAAGLSKQDKTYDVTMRLGLISTTGDEEGVKTTVNAIVPSESAIEEALHKLEGDIMQVPPQFSAMKINGQRAYKLARAGQEVVLEARPVTIYASKLTKYEYPDVQFTTKVSSGTYIRSLVEDIGEILTTGAYMADLRRTGIADFSLEQAISISGLTSEIVEANLIQIE